MCPDEEPVCPVCCPQPVPVDVLAAVAALIILCVVLLRYF